MRSGSFGAILLFLGTLLISGIAMLVDVPQNMRDGSYSLGVTQSETIRLVIIPATLPGIIGEILLAFSRAIGGDYDCGYGSRFIG